MICCIYRILMSCILTMCHFNRFKNNFFFLASYNKIPISKNSKYLIYKIAINSRKQFGLSFRVIINFSQLFSIIIYSNIFFLLIKYEERFEYRKFCKKINQSNIIRISFIFIEIFSFFSTSINMMINANAILEV